MVQGFRYCRYLDLSEVKVQTGLIWLSLLPASVRLISENEIQFSSLKVERWRWDLRWNIVSVGTVDMTNVGVQRQVQGKM